MVATLIFYFIAFQLVTVLILEVTQSIVISAGDGKYEDPVLLVVFATSASTATFFYLLTVLKLHKRLRQLLTDVYNKLQRKIQNRKQNKVKDVS